MKDHTQNNRDYTVYNFISTFLPYVYRQGYARITHGGLSDTELQMARFQIPDGPDYTDNTKVTYETDQIESDVLFNKKYVTN